MAELVRLAPEMLPRIWPHARKKHWDNIVRAIREIGYPANASAIPRLVQQLMDLNWPGTQQAAAELLCIGEPVIPHVREVLQEHSDDGGWMCNITWLLQRMPPAMAAPLVPELIHLLQVEQAPDPDWDVHSAVVEALAHVGSPAADAAIPLLAELAADESRSEEMRLDALKALRSFMPPAPDVAAPYLQWCLEDSSEEIRSCARTVLAAWQQPE